MVLEHDIYPELLRMSRGEVSFGEKTDAFVRSAKEIAEQATASKPQPAQKTEPAPNSFDI